MNSDLLGSLAAGFADHSIISILHPLWESDTTKWSNVFNEMISDLLGSLAAGFADHVKGLTGGSARPFKMLTAKAPRQ
jgi:hypothetical protein